MIVTFYSFKGGVGRSMAMAACAWLFAQRGLRTLAIDFDLEAPGLERYFFDDRAVLEAVRARPGLIDLVLTYKRALTNKAEFERAEFKQWRAFVEEAIPATPSGGCVDLITAGARAPDPRYAEYALAVRSFDWQDFFHNWRGDRFFDWLRRELTCPDKGYDIVLVDSRTGVTEMGGVCAYQLADTAVLLCAANYQNLDGTKAIVDDFRSDAVTVLRQGRPIEIVVVPARVEDENEAVAAQRDQFFIDFQRTFGSDGMPKVLADAGLDYRNLALKYQPELAIIERLVDSENLARASFERLTDALTLLSDGGRWEALGLREEALARLTGRPIEVRAAAEADVTKRGAGYDVMLAYGAADAVAGAELSDLLTTHGLSVWTERDDPSSGVDPRQLIRALDYSTAVAVAIGTAQPTETVWRLFREARLRDKLIIPILLPGADNPQMALRVFGLEDVEALDLRRGVDDAQQLTRLVLQVGQRPAARQGPSETSSVSPYPGRAAFSEDHSAFFFGRDEECDKLVRAFDAGDVVVLSGPSGVGKTSMVRAGLFPRVRRKEGPFGRAAADVTWRIEELDATEPDFLETLTRFATTRQAGPVLYVIDALDSFPQIGSESEWSARRDAVTRLLSAAASDAKFLLVWRQLLVRPRTPNRVTSPLERPRQLKPEYQETLREWGENCRLTDFHIDGLKPAALREAIEKPAGRAGHLFEPGLVDRLIADSGTLSGAVAQLQIALSDLWESRRRGWLTNRAYDGGGGIGGRYAARAQGFLETSREQFGDSALAFLKALTQVDSGLQIKPVLRDLAAVSTIPALMTPDPIALCESLVTARLVDVRPDQTGVLCALSHAAVPPFLGESVALEAAFRLWQQRLDTYVDDRKLGRGPLLFDAGLGEAERWLSIHESMLTADQRDLIRQSIAARDASEKARRRRARLKVVFGFVPFVLLLGAAYLASERGRQRALDEVRQVNEKARAAEEKLRFAAAERDKLANEATAVRAQLSRSTDTGEREALKQQLTKLNDEYQQKQAQAAIAEKKLDELRQNQLVSASDNSAVVKERDDLRKQVTAASYDRDQQTQRAVKAEDAVAAANKRIATLEDQLKAASAARSPAPENKPSGEQKSPVQQSGGSSAGGGKLISAGLRVSQESIRVHNAFPLMTIFVGVLRDSGAQVIVLPNEETSRLARPIQSSSSPNYSWREDRVVSQVRGRCLADATVSMKGPTELRFAHSGKIFALRLSGFMNSGVDRSMTFDLFESDDGGDVTQNICRPQASAK